MKILYLKKEKERCIYVYILCLGIIIGFLISTFFPTKDYFNLNDDDFSSFGYLDAPMGYLDNHKHYSENKSIAYELYNKVRVLCWIMTAPHNHDKKARYVRATWGKRCNVLLFMSSKKDDSLPTVALPVGEGRDNLWAKTKEAFRYVHKHHRNDADWFLKADDDTYVIMENLRYMLMPYNASEPLYFGCRFKPFVEQGYMSGGAGYVLSAESVRRLVDEAMPNKTLCSQSNAGSEDVEVGKCLEGVGVKAMDTRDLFGRGRFFPFAPHQHVIPLLDSRELWYWNYLYYKAKPGIEGCSDIAVSFHYVLPKDMFVLEYLIYHLRPVGIVYQVDIEWPIKLK